MELADLYLKDGVSQVDYVLVYSWSTISKRRYFKRIYDNLLAQLDELNVEYEESTSADNNDIRCLKIHISTAILEEFADFQSIEIAYKSKRLEIAEYQKCCKFVHTVLTKPDPKNESYKRMRTIGTALEPTLSQAERILLTYLILDSIKFGKGFHEQGVERILKIGVFKAIFPLHEGGSEWSDVGSLTQRQLLARYWNGVDNIAKIQPLNTLERYFGPEMAFLYAYLEHSTVMQLVAGIIGLFFYIVGILAESNHSAAIREYICSSDKLMCPTCNPKFCKPRPLKTYCGGVFKLNQTFDNLEMFLLGICITLWGTIFMELWKRKETLFKLRWNLASYHADLEIREGYEERTRIFALNPFTNELEPTMTGPDVALRVFISAASVIILICLVFALEVIVIMMKVQLKLNIDQNESLEIIHKNVDAIASVIGSSITVALIITIDMVYQNVSKLLTDWENPRTQKEYDNSYMMKCFLFAFANNYTMLLYIAFFKGRFYTNPGDKTLQYAAGAYMADTCHLGECNSDLALQVMLILGIKHLFIKCVARYFFRIGYVMWKKYKSKKKSSDVVNEQWERDYILQSFGRYDIMRKYIEIILRHGMVLFFTSVCPFTPFLTFIVNIVEMKLYSYAYIHFYRRPIPRKVQGIEMFYYILQALTWFGVTVNAILAVMTKDFGRMHYYMNTVNYNVTEYMGKTFSVFPIDEFKDIDISHFEIKSKNTVCYFPGHRYPPDHPRKYEEHEDVYRYKAFSWMMVVVYLHVVFLLTRLIAALIPDISSEVTDYLNSAHAEDMRDLRLFRNQQYKSRKSLIIRPAVE